MTAEWCERARPWVGDEPTSWVASLAGRSDLPALRADDLTDAMVSDVARAALLARSEKSSVFTQANLYADVERQLHGVLFAPGERTKVSERAVEAALGMAVKLSPPELAHVPARLPRPRRHQPVRPRHYMAVHHGRAARGRGPPARRRPGHLRAGSQLRDGGPGLRAAFART